MLPEEEANQLEQRKLHLQLVLVCSHRRQRLVLQVSHASHQNQAQLASGVSDQRRQHGGATARLFVRRAHERDARDHMRASAAVVQETARFWPERRAVERDERVHEQDRSGYKQVRSDRFMPSTHEI